jgi:hypothetical protein
MFSKTAFEMLPLSKVASERPAPSWVVCDRQSWPRLQLLTYQYQSEVKSTPKLAAFFVMSLTKLAGSPQSAL